MCGMLLAKRMKLCNRSPHTIYPTKGENFSFHLWDAKPKNICQWYIPIHDASSLPFQGEDVVDCDDRMVFSPHSKANTYIEGGNMP